MTLDPNNVPEAIEQTRWLAGLGIHAGQAIDGQINPVRYLHGDLIGSTLMTTDQFGEPVSYQVGGPAGPMVSSVKYTAFGELVIEWTDDQGQLHCQVGGALPAELGELGANYSGRGANVRGELPLELGEPGAPPVNRYWYAGAWGYETGGLPTGGVAVSAVSYTAFGEPTGDARVLGTRCQYAGAWGYETSGLPTGGLSTGGFPTGGLLAGGDPASSDPNRSMIALYGPDPDLPPITLMHVGYRWYDPAAGRFIQRDPIGLRGGLNVHSYCGAEAINRVDPDGCGWISRILRWLRGLVVDAAVRLKRLRAAPADGEARPPGLAEPEVPGMGGRKVPYSNSPWGRWFGEQILNCLPVILPPEYWKYEPALEPLEELRRRIMGEDEPPGGYWI